MRGGAGSICMEKSLYGKEREEGGDPSKKERGNTFFSKNRCSRRIPVCTNLFLGGGGRGKRKKGKGGRISSLA